METDSKPKTRRQHLGRRNTVKLLALLCLPAWAQADVEIDGLSGEVRNNVELTLSVADENCESPEWKIRDLYAQADQEIDQAMRAFGYYHSQLAKQLRFGDGCWQAHFVIAPGPRTSIAEINVEIRGEAAEDPAFVKLREQLLQQRNQALNHADYESMKRKINALAAEQGYLQAKFLTHRLHIDKQQHSASIDLVFDSGPRNRFGVLSIDQDVLDPALVERFVSFKSGDYYSAKQLAQTHAALTSSPYFQRVDLQPDLDNIQDLQVPVTLTLHPRKTHHYTVGIGYDTDKGPLLGGGYQNRRLNRDGHVLNADLDVSPVLATATLEYTVPLQKPASDYFSFGGGIKREDTDSYQSLSGKLSARVKKSLDSGWKQTLFLDSVYESYKTDGDDDSTLLLLPGGSWLRSVSDDPVRPRQGYRIEFNVIGSAQNPLSDINLAQAHFAAVWQHPMPWRSRLLVRAEQGATLVDDFSKLPTTYRFYAGGMNSIRGYSYKELGPTDAAGNVIGGRFVSVLSLEYEQGLFDDWGIAAFIDSGNAYEPDDIRIKTGAGLGLRWYSPFGLVRFDLATPIGQPDGGIQFHFAAGTRL
ncbi:autotransporter assembly complex protein TamA [Methylomonas rhizoryzae]|uniref:autotransporter assembly complex protein TamA n=1 Tax=Methylomonas rhizoryzae TaxID=2608981 RepID=UPI001231EE0E|nr:autotransporter assembly complex family protein [Methylomonas rhizoryzae]